MPGAFIPQCDEQGDFMPVQCHASTGACWCANSDGTEIDGTRGMYRGNAVLSIETCAWPPRAASPCARSFLSCLHTISSVTFMS